MKTTTNVQSMLYPITTYDECKKCGYECKIIHNNDNDIFYDHVYCDECGFETILNVYTTRIQKLLILHILNYTLNPYFMLKRKLRKVQDWWYRIRSKRKIEENTKAIVNTFGPLLYKNRDW